MQIRSTRSQRPAQLAGGAGFHKLVDQRRGTGEPNAPPLLTRRHAQAQRQVGLARARFADQHHRLRPPDVAARGKVGDPRRRHGGLLEVELGQGLDPGQTGFLDPTHHPLALTLLNLGRQQRIEILDVAMSLTDCRLGQRLELPGHRRHLQSTAMVPDRLLVKAGGGRRRLCPGHGATS
jgi:hypothetical protein